MELVDDAAAAAAQGVTSISLISPEARQTSNRDALLRLRPIVLGLQDNSYDDLCRSLIGMRDFLQVTSLSRDKGEISNVLANVYIELRKLEAARVLTEGDVPVDEKYRNAAIEIRNAILFSNLQEIPGGNGVKVYPGFVPNLQDVGTMIKVIVRPEDDCFWDRCISLSLQGRPVCGVGNPGIGKTTTSIYLLQKLVRDMHRPVIYTIRKKAGSQDVFYDITPVVKNDRLSDVIVKVFEILPAEKSRRIPAMKNDKAVFCVDPGLYEFSCDDRDELFEANFIMISSNDEKHWDGTNFTKFRGASSQLRLPGDPASSLPGILVFASLWTGRQVIAAKPYLDDIRELDDNEVQYRVRVVGGSLRDVLFFDEATFTNKVQISITGLETNTVHQLVEAKYMFSFKPQAPSNVLVGIGHTNKELTLYKATLTSDYVEECLATAHLKMAWYAVLDEDNSSNRGIFSKHTSE